MMFLFFFFVPGVRLVCIALEHIRTLTYTFVLFSHYFNTNFTFLVKKKKSEKEETSRLRDIACQKKKKG